MFTAINEFIGPLANMIGVGSALLAGLAWWKARQIRAADLEQERLDEQPIQIIIFCEGEQLTLPYTPRRDQMSRAELLGILGMYYPGPNRFELDPTSTFESGAFNDMLEGKSGSLTVRCTQTEFEQFKSSIGERSGSN